MDRSKNLWKREKTILLKKSGVVGSVDEAKKYAKVEIMDPCVETYCWVYTEDLSCCVGLSSEYLPPAMTAAVLLNPRFGLQKRMVGAGLLTGHRYKRGRSSKCNRLRELVTSE